MLVASGKWSEQLCEAGLYLHLNMLRNPLPDKSCTVYSVLTLLSSPGERQGTVTGSSSGDPPPHSGPQPFLLLLARWGLRSFGGLDSL